MSEAEAAAGGTAAADVGDSAGDSAGNPAGAPVDASGVGVGGGGAPFRLTGRILFLCDDADLIERQLRGEDLAPPKQAPCATTSPLTRSRRWRR